MLTNWVPREANVVITHIPSKLSFLADLAYATQSGSGFKIAPVFPVQNQNASEFTDHVGDFELEVVVVGDNFSTKSRTIKFRFDGKSPVLWPLP